MSDDEEIDMDNAINRMLDICHAIRAKHPDAEKPDPDGEPPYHKMTDDYVSQPDVTGEMECTACKSGKLQYRISSYNGHISAVCSTEDCARFLQ